MEMEMENFFHDHVGRKLTFRELVENYRELNHGQWKILVRSQTISQHNKTEIIMKFAFLRAADCDCYGDFYAQAHNYVYSICVKYLKSRENAEDAMIEVMFKLWKYRKTFNFDRSLMKWINAITKNYCLDRIKYYRPRNKAAAVRYELRNVFSDTR